MKTLFVRVLVWYLALLVLTTGGVLVLNMLREPSVVSGRVDNAGRAQILQTAVRLREAEGPARVGEYLRELESDLGLRVIAAGADGRGLADDADWSHLVASAGSRLGSFVYQDSRLYLAATDPNGNWIFFEVPRTSMLLSAQNLWMFGVALLLCYVLARHLMSPLKRLRAAVERFGTGDFSSRVNSRRRDELGQLARTFDGMADRIESLVEGQRTLLGDISHELRSPLTRLRLAVDLGKSGRDPVQAYDRIEKEAARLDALVEELLSWTRYDNGDLEPGRTEVRLDRLVDDLVKLNQLEAEAIGCRFVLESPEPVSILANEEALRRAFENVMKNAMRFSPAGDPITIRIERSQDAVEISIRDRGPGVPDALLPRLFEAFFRVESDRSRDTGGVGLGLAIAAKAIEAHGGTILARNCDPGLEVMIRLPRGAARPDLSSARHPSGLGKESGTVATRSG